VESRAGSKSTEKKRSKGKGGKKRSERRASTSSAAASQGDETTPGNRPDAQEDTGASESDVDRKPREASIYSNSSSWIVKVLD